MRPSALLKLAALSALLLGGAAAVRAQAVLTELMASAGGPLLAYARASHDDGLRTLLVNGARLQMRTGSTPASIATVLEDYSAPCRGDGDALEPIVRTEREDQGFVGCIVPRASQDLSERVRAFIATRDLAALGELRVTWAMRTEHGTRYVTLAASDELKLLDMFPAEGDAPGSDVPDVPRPAAARRLLSTWQEQQAPMIACYGSAQPVDAAVESYARELRATGRHVERVPTPGDGERVLYVGGEHPALAVLAADAAGSLISIIPLAQHATAPQRAR